MKAEDICGVHLGKKLAVNTAEIAIAGTLLRVVHTQGVGKVDLTFKGLPTLSVKPDADVEVLV